jgi:hypothetical protein|tara:strand:- start:56 stop:631 length:576 start_codon:yes stop_codon:yes gene_type:complete
MSDSYLNYVEYEQFLTKEETVTECLNMLKETLSDLGIDSTKYTYIEPSAGDGVFLNKLPKERRIGVDIEPMNDEVIKSNFLEWNPPTNQKYITVGNPPFGMRGSKAVKFIRYSSQFSDVVAFIVPEYFVLDNGESDQYEDYPYNMVFDGMKLVHSKELEKPVSMRLPNGEDWEAPLGLYFHIYVKNDINKK